MSELKPCPFCGNNSGIDVYESTEDREGIPCGWHCPECGALSPWEYTKDRRPSPNLWNTRAELPDDLRADVLALCEAIIEYNYVEDEFDIDIAKRISERLRGGEWNKQQ